LVVWYQYLNQGPMNSSGGDKTEQHGDITHIGDKTEIRVTSKYHVISDKTEQDK
jgi:hypothetical protein